MLQNAEEREREREREREKSNPYQLGSSQIFVRQMLATISLVHLDYGLTWSNQFFLGLLQVGPMQTGITWISIYILYLLFPLFACTTRSTTYHHNHHYHLNLTLFHYSHLQAPSHLFLLHQPLPLLQNSKSTLTYSETKAFPLPPGSLSSHFFSTEYSIYSTTHPKSILFGTIKISTFHLCCHLGCVCLLRKCHNFFLKY